MVPDPPQAHGVRCSGDNWQLVVWHLLYPRCRLAAAATTTYVANVACTAALPSGQWPPHGWLGTGTECQKALLASSREQLPSCLPGSLDPAQRRGPFAWKAPSRWDWTQQALQHRNVGAHSGLGIGHGLPMILVGKPHPQIKAFQQSMHMPNRIRVGETRPVLGGRHTLPALTQSGTQN